MTGTNLLTGAVPLTLSIPTVVDPPPAPTVNALAPVSLAALSPTQIASALPAQITPSNPIGSGSKIISAGLQSPISSLVSRQLRIGTANDRARTIGLNPN